MLHANVMMSLIASSHVSSDDVCRDVSGSYLQTALPRVFCLCALRCWTPQPGTKAHDRDRTGDLFLTKEVLYRLSYVSRWFVHVRLERETGFEPATLSLEG